MSVLSIKEQVSRALDTLSETELQQVAQYVAFLQFRAHFARQPVADVAELTSLYAEFAAEDRALAEGGSDEYGDQLRGEDYNNLIDYVYTVNLLV